jgi:3-isopropylmalate/(R)-2-methylmalate dehydratase large subunit
VSPQDLILHTIARLGAAAGTGCAIEFAGPLIERLGVEERMTICNLAVEIGAKIGLVAPDDVTFAYVDSRRYAPSGSVLDAAVAYWRGLTTDDGAAFDREGGIDASAVAPQISWGTSPAHTSPVDGRVPDPADAPDDAAKHQWTQAIDYMGLHPGQLLEGLPIQWCFIGSCTNGRLFDLRAAAAVVDGGRVASHVRALVVPGSAAVRRAAEAEGLDRLFTAAGFEWGEAGCGLCPGLGGVQLAPGDRCVSTSNRNFMGRQGTGVRTHLAGPAMAAYAAIHGCIADVRRVA